VPTADIAPAIETIVRRAGSVALDHFRRVSAERKPDRSLVTAADRAVEWFLIRELEAVLPGAAVLGEESGSREGKGPNQVVIDPIDGTAAFVAGLPTWCICVGVMENGVPVIGVVHLPCTGETYSASQGTARWNGNVLPPLGTRVSPGDPFLVTDGRAHRRRRIRYAGKVRSLGSGAYHVVLVARGVADAALLGRAHLWDLAAPGALLFAVGGHYEYLGGTTVHLASLADGRPAPGEVVAGDPAVLARLRPQLSDA
jgi:myo-inositol-1(or 4)-monophosphatase